MRLNKRTRTKSFMREGSMTKSVQRKGYTSILELEYYIDSNEIPYTGSKSYCLHAKINH